MSENKGVDIRDVSKHEFLIDAEEVDEETIMAGSMQRIAETLERMNTNIERLIKLISKNEG